MNNFELLKEGKNFISAFYIYIHGFTRHFNILKWSYDPRIISCGPWKIKLALKQFFVNNIKTIDNFEIELLKEVKTLY